MAYRAGREVGQGEKTIPDRHAIVRQLWGEYLTFTPGCRDRELFDADMRSMNPVLLADALKEGIGAQRGRVPPAQEQRRSIHQIYARKVKELSSLYPFIFAVENGLRSALADQSAAKFGRMDWWVLIRDARAAGLDHTSFPRIGTTIVNSGFVQAVFRVFDVMTNPVHIRSVAGDEKSDEFYYTLSLGDLWSILRYDWDMTRAMFCSDKELGMKLDIKVFNDTMRVIKDARNEIYHSNPTSHRTQVVVACERLLNGLNVHLGDYDADIGAAHAKRVPATVKRSARHLVPAHPC
jgi:hypothetical protein